MGWWVVGLTLPVLSFVFANRPVSGTSVLDLYLPLKRPPASWVMRSVSAIIIFLSAQEDTYRVVDDKVNLISSNREESVLQSDFEIRFVLFLLSQCGDQLPFNVPRYGIIHGLVDRRLDQTPFMGDIPDFGNLPGRKVT